MYKIKNFNFKGEKVFILNKGNKIASTYKGRETHVIIYEKNLDESDYKFNQEIKFNSVWGIIDLALLLNEMIIISSRKYIYIFKKDNNSKYHMHQDFFNSDWAEITNIKELYNVKDHFAVCGYYGLIIFKKQNDKYEITFEIDHSILGTNRIADFMEIKGKEQAFILCGVRNIFITSNKNVLNKINFHENDKKSWLGKDYICEFSDELFLVSGQKYITLVNINENKFEQINFFKGKRVPVLGASEIYKYDVNTIILLSFNEILFIQIFDNKKVQINMIFCIQNVNNGLLKFINEEKSVYFIEEKKIFKLTFNNKIKYI